MLARNEDRGMMWVGRSGWNIEEWDEMWSVRWGSGRYHVRATMIVSGNCFNFCHYDCSPVDCGLLAGNMILSAWSMGVGSVCLGSPVRFIDSPDNPACEAIMEVRKKLGFSEGYKMIVCIGFGYADESPKAKPRDESKYRFIEL